MEGASATLNSSIVGSGTTSLIKVSGNTSINGSGSLNGNLEYCDANGVETNNGNINAPAALACNVYIPTSSCNTSGNGTPSVSDADNDGVADGNDLFPNDPARAGESYYPGANQYGTLAFEDLWPGKGDYDFNDIVLDFRYRLITDANNEVKDIEIDYALRAIGGSLTNGFGMEFSVPSSSVSNVTGTQYFENNIALNGNGTEAAQSNAVVILFDNAFGVLPNSGTQTVNTNPSDPASIVDSNKVTITFASAMSQSQVAFNTFNPFIYIGQDRGKELHLMDREPTDLANLNYLGTGDDNSNPSSGKYYVTENNLPWALEMAASFDYPVEKEDIVQTYSLFATWAQSSGASSSDWYLDLPGYRDNAKVY
jgi:LruC domain-containing protein